MIRCLLYCVQQNVDWENGRIWVLDADTHLAPPSVMTEWVKPSQGLNACSVENLLLIDQ